MQAYETLRIRRWCDTASPPKVERFCSKHHGKPIVVSWDSPTSVTYLAVNDSDKCHSLFSIPNPEPINIYAKF